MDLDEQFVKEVELIHLLYYRNKNQFKSTIWWKQFSMLHRYCIRYSQTKDEKVAKFIIKKLIPSAYRAFNGVIAQGQFITLGFTLLGLLARINSLLLPSQEQVEAKDEPVKAVDLGERISRDAIKKKRPIESVKEVPDKENPKKKKKKKKSTIDDIFGI